MRFVLHETALNGDDETLRYIDRLVDRLADEVHRVEVPAADLLKDTEWYSVARPSRRAVITSAVAVPPQKTSAHALHAKSMDVRNTAEARVADKLAHASLVILVEDREADGILLDIFVEELGSSELKQLWKQGKQVTPRAIEYQNAGGLGAMPQRVQRIVEDALGEGRSARLFVVCDSDARWPGDNTQPSSTAVQNLREMCNAKTVSLHVLSKRNAENYIPDAVIQAKRNTPQMVNYAPKFDAFLRRPRAQRDHFPMKQGLSTVERQDAVNAGLYEPADAPDLDLLRHPLFSKKPRPILALSQEYRSEFTAESLAERDGTGEINLILDAAPSRIQRRIMACTRWTATPYDTRWCSSFWRG